MSINDLVEKIKPFYTPLLLIVVASIFFALGRLSAIEEKYTPIKIIQKKENELANTVSSIKGQIKENTKVVETLDSGEVIGSKNGKKYYFPWCGTLKSVKLENRINFKSIEEARQAGYTPAGNCKGLK